MKNKKKSATVNSDLQAVKLRRACRKERKAFNALCDETDNQVENCVVYLKAKKARKKLTDELVESV